MTAPLQDANAAAVRIIARCRELAAITDVPGTTTRTFLSEATKGAHAQLLSWMMQAGLTTRVDDAGNVRGWREATTDKAQLETDQLQPAPTVVLFSHIDTVPDAGAFDGVLGVLLALEVIASLGVTPLPFAVELIALSEEEGVRFGFPFLSSRALLGELDAAMLTRTDANGTTVADALRGFGLEPERIATSCALPANMIAAIEVHIEQGPVLEAADASIAVVESIVGQTRLALHFTGQANHAGTTPMQLRSDALAAAAEWIVAVEGFAREHRQLVATVGRLDVTPNASNVIAGSVAATLDVRHPLDESRHSAVARMLTMAEAAAAKRGVDVRAETALQQRTVRMDAALTTTLQQAAEAAGFEAHRMFSGAGHDAMVLAPHVPTAMLFVRSPGGLSHHPREAVRVEDVAAAFSTVVRTLHTLAAHTTHANEGVRSPCTTSA